MVQQKGAGRRGVQHRPALDPPTLDPPPCRPPGGPASLALRAAAVIVAGPLRVVEPAPQALRVWLVMMALLLVDLLVLLLLAMLMPQRWRREPS